MKVLTLYNSCFLRFSIFFYGMSARMIANLPAAFHSVLMKGITDEMITKVTDCSARFEGVLRSTESLNYMDAILDSVAGEASLQMVAACEYLSHVKLEWMSGFRDHAL